MATNSSSQWHFKDFIRGGVGRDSNFHDNTFFDFPKVTSFGKQNSRSSLFLATLFYNAYVFSELDRERVYGEWNYLDSFYLNLFAISRSTQYA